MEEVRVASYNKHHEVIVRRGRMEKKETKNGNGNGNGKRTGTILLIF